MRIPRHNIDERTSILPVPLMKPEYWPAERLKFHTPVYENGVLKSYHITRRQEMHYAQSCGRVWQGRMDIILLNEKVPCTCKCCGNEHDRHVQYCVYPAENGTIVGAVDKLSEEDKAWALEESMRCWQVALEEPALMAWYKRGLKI